MDGLNPKRSSDYAEHVIVLGLTLFVSGLAAWDWRLAMIASGLILTVCGGVATLLRAREK